MPLYLRITSTPQGEGPLWVREKWVGLALPLAQPSLKPHTFRVSGVLTGPKVFRSRLIGFFLRRFAKQTGYAVYAVPAIELLAQSSPEAADWWHENVPHFIKPKRFFVFDESAGHIEDLDA